MLNNKYSHVSLIIIKVFKSSWPKMGQFIFPCDFEIKASVLNLTYTLFPNSDMHICLKEECTSLWSSNLIQGLSYQMKVVWVSNSQTSSLQSITYNCRLSNVNVMRIKILSIRVGFKAPWYSMESINLGSRWD